MSSGRLIARGSAFHSTPSIVKLRDQRRAPAGGVHLLLDDQQPAGLLDARARPHRCPAAAASAARSPRRRCPRPRAARPRSSARSSISSVATIVTSEPSRTTTALPTSAMLLVAAPDRPLARRRGRVLEEQHRVARADRGAQHAVGAVRRAGRRDLQARQAHVPGLAGRGVLRAEAAGRPADRRAPSPARRTARPT